MVGRIAWLFLCAPALAATAEEVLALTSKTFDEHLNTNKYTLVEFYAPWCGHCKKLAPEYEKAASLLKGKVPVVKIDATEEKDVASKYGVKGYPMLIWFDSGKNKEYDGGKTADAIVEWVTSMTGPAVKEIYVSAPESLTKVVMVLYGPSLLKGFEAAANANRRKALWYYKNTQDAAKVVLQHQGEDSITISDYPGDQKTLEKYVHDHELPMFGKLDADSFDKYLESGKGLVWSLFELEGGRIESVEEKHRPMMQEVARKFQGKYAITYSDTEKFKDALAGMVGVTKFPAIAVQKKAGDKKKYLYTGEMTSAAIIRFVEDVESGRIQPNLKTEPAPSSNSGNVRTVVGSTFREEIFSDTKDVFLFVSAPWCGHCKKLDPEYEKLANKLRSEELDDLIKITKIDGVANDSPDEAIEWTGFPTLLFFKAKTREPLKYEGERTANGLWKYIRRHASQFAEIKIREDKRKAKSNKFSEL